MAGQIHARAQTVDVRNRVVDDLSGVRRLLQEMSSSGMPANITYTDQSVKNLLASLSALNERLRPQNGGNDVIPISGANDRERFLSINNWLDRNPEAPLDMAAVDSLQIKIELAMASRSADLAAAGMAGALATEPEHVPMVSGPTSESLRAENHDLIEDLEFISANGRNPQVRKAAAKHLQSLNRAFDARKINLKTTQKEIASARAFSERERERAAAAAVTADAAPAGLLIDLEDHPNYRQVVELRSYFQDRTYNEIRVSEVLSDMWYLGEQSMNRALNIMNGAMADLRSGNGQAAIDKIQEARNFIDGQLRFYRYLTETLTLPTAIASHEAISILPTRETLNGGRLDRNPNPRYFLMRSSGNYNGREDLEELFSKRVEATRKLLEGKVSFHLADELYRAVSTDGLWIHNLIELWKYAQDQGMGTPTPDSEIWKAYGVAAMSFADPGFNPYDHFNPAQGQRIERLHPGVPTSVLAHSIQYRYDDVTFNFYQEIMQDLVEPTQNHAVASLASIRSMRQMYYLIYTGPESKNVETGADLRPTIAQNYLSDTISAAESAGIASEVVNSARAQLETNQPDQQYEAALGLAAIVEAHLWLGSQSLFSTEASRMPEARATLDLAERQYIWTFSRPEIESLYHTNIARNLADGATAAIAPRAFRLTEGHAMFYCRAAAQNPHLFTGQEDSSERPLVRPTELISQAAITAETRNLTLFLNVRDNPRSFAAPAGEMIAETNGMLGPISVISFGVGQGTHRSFPGFDFSFPQMPQLSARERPTVSVLDSNIVPYDNTIDSIGTMAHESIGYHQWGSLYVEVLKQMMIAYDDSAPAPLRNFRFSPTGIEIRTGGIHEAEDTELRRRLVALSGAMNASEGRPLIDTFTRRTLGMSSNTYATRTPEQQQIATNLALIRILDVRIAELETRLNHGRVELSNGDVYAIRALERSDSPEAYQITRAREMLDAVKALRAQFHAARSSNLSAAPTNPRQAIAIAENAIESISEDHLTGMEPPSETAETYPVGISQKRERERGTTYTRATVTIRNYTPAQNERVTYYVLAFQDLGTREGGSTLHYLRNPRHGVPGQEEFVGMVVRGARLTDGTTGDFVVRVRPTQQTGTTGRRYEPIAESDGRFNPEQVLFRVEGGEYQLKPVDGDMFRSTRRETAFTVIRSSNTCEVRVPRSGDTVFEATYEINRTR